MSMIDFCANMMAEGATAHAVPDALLLLISSAVAS